MQQWTHQFPVPLHEWRFRLSKLCDVLERIMPLCDGISLFHKMADLYILP